jgi:hypothetical protein
MANVCNSVLTIQGPEAALEEFRVLVAGVGGDDELCLIDFRQHAPLLDPANEDYEDPCLDTWGTKSTPCSYEVKCFGVEEAPEQSCKQLRYVFTTRNSPPDAWLGVVASLHRECRFHLIYGEGGLRFAGEVECANGELVRAEEFQGAAAVELLGGERDLLWMIGLGPDDFESESART